MLHVNLLKQFLNSVSTAKKVIKKRFNKNLIMREEDEHLFQQSNRVVGFVKNLLIMTMKKLEIIDT